MLLCKSLLLLCKPLLLSRKPPLFYKSLCKPLLFCKPQPLKLAIVVFDFMPSAFNNFLEPIQLQSPTSNGLQYPCIHIIPPHFLPSFPLSCRPLYELRFSPCGAK